MVTYEDLHGYEVHVSVVSKEGQYGYQYRKMKILQNSQFTFRLVNAILLAWFPGHEASVVLTNKLEGLLRFERQVPIEQFGDQKIDDYFSRDSHEWGLRIVMRPDLKMYTSEPKKQSRKK